MTEPKTRHQREALEFLHAFARATHPRTGPQPVAVLKGYSGTGKTWVVSRFLQELMTERSPTSRTGVLVCAPTNKALDVLRQKCGHVQGVDFRTIDSFLGYKIKKNEDGETERRRHGKPLEYALILCDEASMVRADYIEELRRQGAPIVFIGDPAQLQPVGEEESKAFAFEHAYLMEEIVRTEQGNPIGELSQWLRLRVDSGRPYILEDVRSVACENAWDSRVSFIKLDRVHDWAEAAYKRGWDCRILAFDNATVHFHNARMHSRLYPGCPLFGVGEVALANEAFELDDTEDTLITNGEQMEVLACDEAEPIAGVRVFDVRVRLPAALQFKIDGDVVHTDERVVKVAYDDGHRYARHKELTDQIWTLRREGKDYREVERLIDLRKPLNKLAPLRHSYASTTHKAQGSTYDIAIVDWISIAKSRDMRARLMYVAATRPSQWLAFASK